MGLRWEVKSLIEALGRVKNSFNSYPLDIVAQRAALAAIEDESYFRNSCKRVIKSREALCSALSTLGFDVLPSGANFILASHSAICGERTFFQAERSGHVGAVL